MPFVLVAIGFSAGWGACLLRHLHVRKVVAASERDGMKMLMPGDEITARLPGRSVGVGVTISDGVVTVRRTR